MPLRLGDNIKPEKLVQEVEIHLQELYNCHRGSHCMVHLQYMYTNVCILLHMYMYKITTDQSRCITHNQQTYKKTCFNEVANGYSSPFPPLLSSFFPPTS